VAAYLRAQGADVPLIAEQTDSSKLARFSGALMRYPRKLVQALSLRMKLLGTRYLTSCWPVRAEGDGKIETVTLRRGQRLWPEPCDYLACGFGLVPNLDLPLLLGCKIRNGFVTVGDDVATSLPGVYAVGELTGIAGVDKAIYEGRTGRGYPRHFEQMLAEAFELRPELKELATPDTIVCRCEDVPMASLRPEHNWRSAKLQTRCGMGPCQGRVCGPAVEFLLGWSLESVRPPILPTRIDALQ
jgi:NADPH-dependent 2,4-dienoyl-CoA reductase/sulfur reductase-like enzyme